MSEISTESLDKLTADLIEAGPTDAYDRCLCALFGVLWSSDEEGQFGGYNILPKRVWFTRSLDAAALLIKRVAPDVNWNLQFDDRDGYNASVGEGWAESSLKHGPAFGLVLALIRHQAELSRRIKPAATTAR